MTRRTTSSDKTKPMPPTEIVLEWSFEPRNFIDEPVDFVMDSYRIQILDGNISVLLNPDNFEDKKEFFENIKREITSIFDSEMLVEYKPYEIFDQYSLSKIHADGHQDIDVCLNLIVSAGIVFEAGVLYINKGGNIIRVEDPKAKKDKNKKRFRELIITHKDRDIIAGSIINSFHTAITNPDHEFVHQYEILETLTKRFGDPRKACEALGLNFKNHWDKLRILTCDSRFKQGRHRGQSPGETRDATSDG